MSDVQFVLYKGGKILLKSTRLFFNFFESLEFNIAILAGLVYRKRGHSLFNIERLDDRVFQENPHEEALEESKSLTFPPSYFSKGRKISYPPPFCKDHHKLLTFHQNLATLKNGRSTSTINEREHAHVSFASTLSPSDASGRKLSTASLPSIVIETASRTPDSDESRRRQHQPPKRKISVFGDPRILASARHDKANAPSSAVGLKSGNSNAALDFLTSIMRTDMVKIDGADSDYVLVQHIIGEFTYLSVGS